ncbi:MAG TPA: MotA/TolQ/ExbB proton channel family protein [Myxococcota bacterium]|nr:MotA/TolQ/ExbB proton channel family protein [Myxococcota bacterium]
MSGFAQFFVEGGPWMIPIAIISAITLAVVIERIYALCFVYNTDATKLYAKVSQALSNNQEAEAVSACDKLPKTALSHVLKAGIASAGRGEEAVASGIEVATLEITPKVTKRTSSLGGLASIATLLGLLGTVMGLIEAFRVVAEAPADQKSVLLTKAIAVAMNTTAFGLIVAIPATLVYLWLAGTTKRILDDIDVYSLKLEKLLAARRK